jgi:RecA-family ATPase
VLRRPGHSARGFSVLAGKSKLGKSWLALNLALAVASGGTAIGSIDVEQGEVLYLALEDTKRRLQGRLRKILAATEAEPPAGLTLATSGPRQDRAA